MKLGMLSINLSAASLADSITLSSEPVRAGGGLGLSEDCGGAVAVAGGKVGCGGTSGEEPVGEGLAGGRLADTVEGSPPASIVPAECMSASTGVFAES